MASSVGIYVHVPFCTAKCHYCDFNSYAGLDRLFGTYLDAVCREIGELPHAPPAEPSAGGMALRARTIFFGGGTPSLLEPSAVARILAAIGDRMAVADDVEVSLEANPGTVVEKHLADLRRVGVNRISFGVQSFDPELLAEMGRIHSPDQAARARKLAQRAGFESVNLDFIYGLPRQTMPTWCTTLQRALELRPEHLSLYALSVESGTPFHRRAERGQLPLPDEDLVADMYELASEMLEGAGYEQYEVSNWSLGHRHRCRHNLGYWLNEEYLGIGPGAHSWFGGKRYVDVLSPVAWAARVTADESAAFQVESIDRELALRETLMLGLRLAEGIDLAQVSRRFGVDVAALCREQIRETGQLGLTELVDGHLRMTRRARLLGNEVFRRFLIDPLTAAA